MLNNSIFGKIFGIVWFLILFTIVVNFSGRFIAWWSPFEAKAWAALLVIAGILYFTNQGLINGVIQFIKGSSGVSMQSAGSVSNDFFFGRPPMEFSQTTERLAFSEEDNRVISQMNSKE